MSRQYKRLSSEVYNHDKPVGKTFGDIEFYLDVLQNVKGKVLEPACGNGRVLIPLYEQGIDIEGFDRSADMLHYLKNTLNQKQLSVNIWSDDMMTFNIENRYEAIIIPAGTFMLLTDYEQAKQTLLSFKKALKSHGRLFIDIYLDSGLKIGDTERKSFIVDENTKIILNMEVKAFSRKDSVCHSEHLYQKYYKDTLIEEELEQFSLKFYSLSSFESLLHDTGFKHITIHENYGRKTASNYPMYTFEVLK